MREEGVKGMTELESQKHKGLLRLVQFFFLACRPRMASSTFSRLGGRVGWLVDVSRGEGRKGEGLKAMATGAVFS